MAAGINVGQQSASNYGGLSQDEWAIHKYMQMADKQNPEELKRRQIAELARKIKHICPRNYNKDPMVTTLSDHFDMIRNNIAAYKDLVDWIQATATVLEAAYGVSSKSPDPVRLRIHLDVLFNGFEAYINQKDKE